jgi:two-component system phosphate regulon response regulator PhoB
MRILVVDDSPHARTILQLFLSAEGFEVTTASGVEEALLCVQEHGPDLIITDYAMPERSGLDLCRHLRTHGHTRHIPIVLHTCTDLPHSETALYDAVSARPASLAQLAQRVHELLAKSKERPPQEYG